MAPSVLCPASEPGGGGGNYRRPRHPSPERRRLQALTDGALEGRMEEVSDRMTATRQKGVGDAPLDRHERGDSSAKPITCLQSCRFEL